MYTKGSWKIYRVEKGWAAIHDIENDTRIATVLPSKSHLAHARLIAAAPKLLEALEANHTLILKLIHDQAVREDYIAEFMGPVIRNNNLIIQKAKGE